MTDRSSLYLVFLSLLFGSVIATTFFDGSFSLLALRCHSFLLLGSSSLAYKLETLNGGVISVYVGTSDCFDGERVLCYDGNLSSLFVTSASLGSYLGAVEIDPGNRSLLVCSNSIDRQITVGGYIRIDDATRTVWWMILILILIIVTVVLSISVIYLWIKRNRTQLSQQIDEHDTDPLFSPESDSNLKTYGTIKDDQSDQVILADKVDIEIVT